MPGCCGSRLPDRLEDRRAFDLLGIGLVGRRRRGVERDGVGDLRLVVVRIFCRELLHRAEERADALGMGQLVVVGIHQHQRVDVVTLALGLGADLLGLLDRGKTEWQVGRGDGGMRIVEQRQRDAPIRHAAFRIGLGDLLEDLLGGAVPKRVLIAHGAVEAALRHLVARRLEMNIAELLVGFALGRDRAGRRQGQRRETGGGCEQGFSHDVPPACVRLTASLNSTPHDTPSGLGRKGHAAGRMFYEYTPPWRPIPPRSKPQPPHSGSPDAAGPSSRAASCLHKPCGRCRAVAAPAPPGRRSRRGRR